MQVKIHQIKTQEGTKGYVKDNSRKKRHLSLNCSEKEKKGGADDSNMKATWRDKEEDEKEVTKHCTTIEVQLTSEVAVGKAVNAKIKLGKQTTLFDNQADTIYARGCHSMQ